LSAETKGGKTITRKADEENPAVRIASDKDGSDVVKRASELEKVESQGGEVAEQAKEGKEKEKEKETSKEEGKKRKSSEAGAKAEKKAQEEAKEEIPGDKMDVEQAPKLPAGYEGDEEMSAKSTPTPAPETKEEGHQKETATTTTSKARGEAAKQTTRKPVVSEATGDKDAVKAGTVDEEAETGDKRAAADTEEIAGAKGKTTKKAKTTSSTTTPPKTRSSAAAHAAAQKTHN